MSLHSSSDKYFAVMLSFCSIGASADVSGAKYSYTQSVSAMLVRSGTTLTGKTQVVGYSGITTKIEIDQYLEICAWGYLWIPLPADSQTTYGSEASLYKNYGSNDPGTYRIRSEIKVYSGSNYESITAYSLEKTIP